MKTSLSRRPGLWLLLVSLIVAIAVYWPGLSGGFLFDDYPNIVDNHGVQPHDASVASLVNAALSSPASEFKRPLASLSFAMNYLTTGLNPYWMKLTNLVIHLLNGLLVFLLARALLLVAISKGPPSLSRASRVGVVAALIAGGWMLLPINLTGVLYVVQRMESMANLFVLLGLIGYVVGRSRMLQLGIAQSSAPGGDTDWSRFSTGRTDFILCIASITLSTAIGILAKETAVMLPFYAFLIECLLFGFGRRTDGGPNQDDPRFTSSVLPARHYDRRVISLFVILLAIPMLLGLIWLVPSVLNRADWAGRNFTLGTRLLSEARIVSDYVVWTLLPTPGPLSFYHDNFVVSTGLLTPWTTLASMVFIALLLALVWWLRQRQSLVALGIALFLGCQLLTGTILPLELVYEHRNYFASFGLLLALVPLLAAPSSVADGEALVEYRLHSAAISRGLSMPFARYTLLSGLMVCWVALTAMTAYAWGSPLRLAEDLASRAPDSPRAQYELGRTYIIYSHYDPASPFTHLAYAPLEKSAALPNSSILPEQALIFMNSRMNLPLKDAWWQSIITKLKHRKPGVQDESSLAALTDCMRRGECKLPANRMTATYLAALSHPHPSARLLALYGDYAWNELGDHDLGERMLASAVKGAPTEPAYQITLIRMLSIQGEKAKAREAMAQLQRLNIGGRLDNSLEELSRLPGMK